jgi:diaminopimelate decarboxylase
MTQAWEIENFLDIRDDQLHIDGVSAVELAREHGTPLFVFSEQRIRHNIARLKKTADVIDRPLKICYAAKAMSTMAILRTVKDAECDIEVNSGGELWKALEIGFTGDQIIFNGTSKEIWELEMAINAGIYAIQVDSLYELSLIEETAKSLGKRANVSLRLVPEIESGTHSGLQTALLTSKFGMMPDEAFAAFRNYRNSPHLDLCGIHLHIGSQNPDPAVYAKALEMLFDSLLRIHRESGVTLKHINLGGGFPVNYSRGKQRPPEHVQKRKDELIAKGVIQREHRGRTYIRPIPEKILEDYAREKMFEADYEPADALSSAWNSIKAKATEAGNSEILDSLTILLEPGRSITADAGICLTTVRNIKLRPLTEINRSLSESAEKMMQERSSQIREQGGVGFGIHNIAREFVDKSITSEHWLLTDAGFNILLSMETYKWYYHLISAERAGEPHDTPYKLAGPLCDGGDVYFDVEGEGRLPEHRGLPPEVQPGEVLALLNCGAYSLAQASQYNGRFLPPVALIRTDGSVELIRKRDGFRDLISNDVY